MDNNQNISFIEDISSNNNIITNSQSENTNSITNIQETNQNNTPIGNPIDDYLKELPNWDINPPLEINRSEQ